MFQLYQKGLIKLSVGKEYREFIERSIYPFADKTEKGQLTKLIRKATRNDKIKATIGKQIDDYIVKLSAK